MGSPVLSFDMDVDGVREVCWDHGGAIEGATIIE
jgi:hypothetical protein